MDTIAEPTFWGSTTGFLMEALTFSRFLIRISELFPLEILFIIMNYKDLEIPPRSDFTTVDDFLAQKTVYRFLVFWLKHRGAVDALSRLYRWLTFLQGSTVFNKYAVAVEYYIAASLLYGLFCLLVVEALKLFNIEVSLPPGPADTKLVLPAETVPEASPMSKVGSEDDATLCDSLENDYDFEQYVDNYNSEPEAYNYGADYNFVARPGIYSSASDSDYSLELEPATTSVPEPKLYVSGTRGAYAIPLTENTSTTQSAPEVRQSVKNPKNALLMSRLVHYVTGLAGRGRNRLDRKSTEDEVVEVPKPVYRLSGLDFLSRLDLINSLVPQIRQRKFNGRALHAALCACAHEADWPLAKSLDDCLPRFETFVYDEHFVRWLLRWRLTKDQFQASIEVEKAQALHIPKATDYYQTLHALRQLDCLPYLKWCFKELFPVLTETGPLSDPAVAAILVPFQLRYPSYHGFFKALDSQFWKISTPLKGRPTEPPVKHHFLRSHLTFMNKPWENEASTGYVLGADCEDGVPYAKLVFRSAELTT